jgi:hypothetical protein
MEVFLSLFALAIKRFFFKYILLIFENVSQQVTKKLSILILHHNVTLV